MKKTILAVALTAVAGSANAAFFAPSSTYNVSVASGCFAFGDCTTLAQNVSGGSFNLNTTDGSQFSVADYLMNDYTGTPGGLFATEGPLSGAVGQVSGSGQLDLQFTGRTGTAQYFPQYAGAAWNIDDGVASGTNVYEGFTTGSDSNVDPSTGSIAITLTGLDLTVASSDPTTTTWAGQLVSVGNVGTQWGSFAGTPYTEVYNIEVTGPTPSVIPIPAAAWLFGSALLGLVGVARRKKA